MNEIVAETLKAGVHGPAVTMFVVMSLLCLAEKNGAGNEEEVRFSAIRIPLTSVANLTMPSSEQQFGE